MLLFRCKPYCRNLLTRDNRRVLNRGNVVLMLHCLLSSENSGSTRYEVSTVIRAGATERVVGAAGGRHSSGEDCAVGNDKEGSKREEDEHLCRTEELVLQMYVKPHQGWKMTDVRARHLLL